MDKALYQAISKRKSFHMFRGVGSEKLTEAELAEIRTAYDGFERLYPEIRTAIRIVPAAQVNFKHDAEYCVMLYSEKKDNWLMNAGYIGEQLDLWLTAHDIGSLWFGIGKPDEPGFDGLDYAIMIAIRKVKDASLFRKDMFKAKRKEVSEIWSGDTFGLAEIARFAPSACNSQPWYVEQSGNRLTVYRRKKPTISMMNAAAAAYFNRIDMGIFLCFLELCMAEKNVAFTRELFVDDGDGKTELSKVAVYTI